MRPKLFHRTVDVYHVLYKLEESERWERQVVETVNNTVNHMVRELINSADPVSHFSNIDLTVKIIGLTDPQECQNNTVLLLLSCAHADFLRVFLNVG
jgi:hypothetical protein